MAVGKRVQRIMDKTKSVYTVKAEGPPDYYLGNNYKQDKKGRLCVGSKEYIKEVLTRIDNIFSNLRKYDNPSETGDNPELDNSRALGDEEHRQYQMLTGILIWVVGNQKTEPSTTTSGATNNERNQERVHSESGRTARLLSWQQLQARQERTPMCRQQEVYQRSTHLDRKHLWYPQEVRQPIRNRRQP